jgi:hypothetical protein
MHDYKNRKTLENIVFGLIAMAVAGGVYFILQLF